MATSVDEVVLEQLETKQEEKEEQAVKPDDNGRAAEREGKTEGVTDAGQGEMEKVEGTEQKAEAVESVVKETPEEQEQLTRPEENVDSEAAGAEAGMEKVKEKSAENVQSGTGEAEATEVAATAAATTVLKAGLLTKQGRREKSTFGGELKPI